MSRPAIACSPIAYSCSNNRPLTASAPTTARPVAARRTDPSSHTAGTSSGTSASLSWSCYCRAQQPLCPLCGGHSEKTDIYPLFIEQELSEPEDPSLPPRPLPLNRPKIPNADIISNRSVYDKSNVAMGRQFAGTVLLAPLAVSAYVGQLKRRARWVTRRRKWRSGQARGSSGFSCPQAHCCCCCWERICCYQREDDHLPCVTTAHQQTQPLARISPNCPPVLQSPAAPPRRPADEAAFAGRAGSSPAAVAAKCCLCTPLAGPCLKGPWPTAAQSPPPTRSGGSSCGAL